MLKEHQLPIAWIKDGFLRKQILLILKEKALLSSEIATLIGTHRSTISRALTEMTSKKLLHRNEVAGSRTVEYCLSDLGKRCLDYLK